MANEQPTGQASTDAGTGTPQNTPAAAAPAAGTAAPAGQPPAAGTNAGAQAGDGNKAGAAAAASKVPDTYDLKVPEGAEKHVDAADLEAWGKKAKEAGWSNEEAQQQLEAFTEQVTAQVAAFRQVTENDPTYGKEHLEANQQLARRFIERVRPAGHPRTEAFNKFLDKTGAGNHLEFFAFFADAGKLIAEDRQPGAGAGAAGQPVSAAEKLYGKTE